MKNVEDILEKLREGGFEEDILKREKGSRPRRDSGIPTRQQRKKKERYLMNLRAFRIFKMLCLLCFEIVWKKSCWRLRRMEKEPCS